MTRKALEDRLIRLESLRAIDDLITDLGRAFDAGPSASALRQLFTDNATFVIDSYGSFTGRDAIAEGVAGNSERGFRWTLHYLVSPRVTLTTINKGGVEFYLWEIATAASGKAYWIGGRYDAEVVVEDGRWRFARLELMAELISHYPEGWHDKPALLAEA